MAEWWTYRPSDFLMFAPGTYWRLFELHNAAWWPLPWVTTLAGLAWTAVLARAARPPGAGWARAGAAALACAWAFVAIAFHLRRYAPIHLGAPAFAAAFCVQAVGLAVLATRADVSVTTVEPRRTVGLALLAWAVAVHPLLAGAAGRGWASAEPFGIAPDPTAIATLGALLAMSATAPGVRCLLRGLTVGAALWCATSAATLATMGSVQAIVPAAAIAAVAIAVRPGARPAPR